ncbi:type VI secretion system tube protein Hcp [Xenorhabdus sp. Reich]|uniref:Type VI secretion system tube protein Hcp n=1 Tax=Xenorhabdus littoralis TaxID=2582835 RepID=A0ABU4SPK6_9GAMM|nr:type VI secretion system tube protein Hcp [Xenorhabdus sp. Reich]MDX8000582.1 type VI secretion system tube protein Hcp [Xenorhabdus sp. Reich]
MSEFICGYLSIKDIKGESKHKKYNDMISIINLKHSVSNSATLNQKTGLCAGTPIIGEVTLEIVYDKSSTALRDYLFKGKHIPEASIFMLTSSSGEEEKKFYVIEMKKVMVTLCTTSYDSACTYANTIICLAFEEFTEIYTGQTFDGKSAADVSGGYNIKTKEIT